MHEWAASIYWRFSHSQRIFTLAHKTVFEKRAKSIVFNSNISVWNVFTPFKRCKSIVKVLSIVKIPHLYH